ncbi:acyl-CoA dehydrogenase family protein [Streptomyces sp. NPDC090088]|uniref:acyl-CoA dehydrogenase family protein n=1 Tax=Streptomyces sp. NPDC090088 TaxID=3365944 RepID=UPI00380F3ABC
MKTDAIRMRSASPLATGDPDGHIQLHGLLDEAACDRLLSERELTLRTQIREVVAADVAPRARELDQSHTFAHDSYQALAQAGFGGLLFPRRWGGTEDTNVAYAVAMEEIAAGCAATSLVFMTQMHAAYPIWQAGSERLADRHLPGIIDGSAYGALAITEPDAGSDVASMKTRARHDGSSDIYRLSGSKTFITTGDKANVLVCFATVDPRLGRKGITAFVVDGDSPGLTRGNPFHKMGMHGSTTAEVFLDQVPVRADHMLGSEGSGWQVVMASVVKSRISAAAQGVGIARAAYAATLAALRAIHGRTLPPEALFALADLRGQILQGRLLLLATARDVDHADNPSRAQIGIMKQTCTDLGFKVSTAAARILGPYGDLADLGVERCVRDAKVTQIYDGTNEVQRLLVGRETTKQLEELE